MSIGGALSANNGFSFDLNSGGTAMSLASIVATPTIGGLGSGLRFGWNGNSNGPAIRIRHGGSYNDAGIGFQIWESSALVTKAELSSTGLAVNGVLSATGGVSVSSAIPASIWSANFAGAAGAARDILLAGLMGYSNGFTVQYNGTNMVYGFLNGNINISPSAPANSLTLDSSGNLLVGTTNTNPVGNRVNGFVVGASGAGSIDLRSASNISDWGINVTSGTIVNFYSDNGSTHVHAGYIFVNGNTTSYVSASDYRLKENVQPMQNALVTVSRLNPVTYTWKDNGASGQGFIAHELQAVVPDCVTGDKDAVDADGKPQYQGVDTSFLVGILTKAIQELSTKNDALEARLAALENK
jgi:hypothetical protein